TPSSSVSSRTNRGFVTCTAEKAQELLDRETRATPILLQPIPQRGIPDQLVNRSADQMGGGLRSRAQQQKDHRDYFVGADAPAFHFNAHELGYQTNLLHARGRAAVAPRGSVSSTKGPASCAGRRTRG